MDYSNFPHILKEALENELSFPAGTLFEYDEFYAYRGIIRNNEDDTPINKKDFYSYIELKKKIRGRPAPESDIGSYSCSLYIDRAMLNEALKLPKPNKKIIRGPVNCLHGPQLTNMGSGHVHWWLYEDADFYDKFEVISDE